MNIEMFDVGVERVVHELLAEVDKRNGWKLESSSGLLSKNPTRMELSLRDGESWMNLRFVTYKGMASPVLSIHTNRLEIKLNVLNGRKQPIIDFFLKWR